MKKNIILGVTGSIAAYKAADIANTLTKEGHSVHVIMTKAGMEFITPLTMQTLTKNKVHMHRRQICFWWLRQVQILSQKLLQG